MQIAPMPANEMERLKALKEYHLLDSMAEAAFDDITHLASDVCHTPCAFISLIDSDHQWIKQKGGPFAPESSREVSFCAHAICTPYEIFIVPDASKDERFFDNPLVTGPSHVLFYAGVPLVNPDGHALGTLCVSDSHPHELTNHQVSMLRSLAAVSAAQLEKRKELLSARKELSDLKKSYSGLESFASVAAHDLKSPLNNIITIVHLLEEDHTSKLDEEGAEYISFLKDTANQMSGLIGGILDYSRSSGIITGQQEPVNIGDIVAEVQSLLNLPDAAIVIVEAQALHIYTSRIALKQILLNLLDNAIKHNDKEQPTITITSHEDRDGYKLGVKDNGAGIPAGDEKIIFDLFTMLKTRGRQVTGSGIGLSIVKRLVEKLRGEISVHSEPGLGTSFVITLPK